MIGISIFGIRSVRAGLVFVLRVFRATWRDLQHIRRSEKALKHIGGRSKDDGE